MDHPFRDREPLTRLQLHHTARCNAIRRGLQVYEETSGEDEEELIVGLMMVPVIFPLHHAQSNDRVIDACQRLVVPRVAYFGDQRINVDEREGREKYVQVRRVGELTFAYGEIVGHVQPPGLSNGLLWMPQYTTAHFVQPLTEFS